MAKCGERCNIYPPDSMGAEIDFILMSLKKLKRLNKKCKLNLFPKKLEIPIND